MKKQFETREALVQDALDYYWGKLERLCVNEGSSICTYTPTETSEGCAIGRLVELEVAQQLQQVNHSLNSRLFAFLPEWLQVMGEEFLRQLQRCHDTGRFVDRDKKSIESFLNEYVDFSKIKFPE